MFVLNILKLLNNMKIIIATLLLLTNTLTSTNLTAQENQTENDVKKVLMKIFELSKNKDDKTLASYIQYTGPDVERKRKDVCNPKNEEELLEVIKVRERINKLLQEKYKLTSFIAKEHPTNQNKSWYVWEVKFNSKTVIFAFQKLNEKYILGDID